MKRIVLWTMAAVVTLSCAAYALNSLGFLPSFLHPGGVRTNLQEQITEGIAIPIEEPALGKKVYTITASDNEQYCIFFCVPGTKRSANVQAPITASATIKLDAVKVGITYYSDPNGATPGHVAVQLNLPAPVLPTSTSQLSMDLADATNSQNSQVFAFGSGVDVPALQKQMLDSALKRAEHDTDLADQARVAAKNILMPLVVSIVNSFNYDVDFFTITYSDGVKSTDTPVNSPQQHKVQPSTSPSPANQKAKAN